MSVFDDRTCACHRQVASRCALRHDKHTS
ncbi:MAG: hypothetical protein DBX97_03125, partial [Collinsella tanakaei]